MKPARPGCFYLPLTMFWDERQISRLEKRIDGVETRIDSLESKMDRGFAEARADYRMLIAIVLPMFLTMILGFAGLLLQRL